jgi:hypothetical protein
VQETIPLELRSLAQWVIAGPDKLPHDPRTGSLAKVNDSTTWASFEDAVTGSVKFNKPNLGFVLVEENGLFIIDLDNKPHKPLTEAQLKVQDKILTAFSRTYTELSVSGAGYHIIGKGKAPAGKRRDFVEIYTGLRYLICTGNTVNSAPVQDCQKELDKLLKEITKKDLTVGKEYVEQEALDTDDELVAYAEKARNGDAFVKLYRQGDFTEYTSNSEADYALLSLLCFYSKNNTQVERLFLASALGKREKVHKRHNYILRSINNIRSNEPPPLDFSALVNNARKRLDFPKPPIKHTTNVSTVFNYPPGLVGDVAEFIFNSSVRPVKEVALAAALGFIAGICGRTYNVSGTGLNLYLLLLARTGTGKEGALVGMEKLISALRPNIPSAEQFMGPAAFASGQALVKVLNDKPCFVSVLGEFGLTLQQLHDKNATASSVMLRKVILDLYGKSGFNRLLQPSVYSDTTKNTKSIRAPSVTLLGESTPETFYEALDYSHIAEGLLPRFIIIEYAGGRPTRNNVEDVDVPTELLVRLQAFAVGCLSAAANNAVCPVLLDAGGKQALDDLDLKADSEINNAANEGIAQLWNRAHLKTLKLAALVAAGVNPAAPIITVEIGKWAVAFVENEIAALLNKFSTGDFGKGENKQLSAVRALVKKYCDPTTKDLDVPPEMHEKTVVPYSYLSRRLFNTAAFRTDRMGATNALKRTLATLVEEGALVQLNKHFTEKQFGFSGTCYIVGAHW